MAELMGTLLMPPESFWRLTLRELDAIVTGRTQRTGGITPMTVRDLSQLIENYPDGAHHSYGD